MPEFDLTWWVPLPGALAHFVLGAVWYSALSVPWMDAQGITREQIEEADGGAATYGTQAIATIALSYGVAWVISALGADTLAEGALAGLVLAAIAVLASSGDFLFELGRGLKLFWINSGYRVIGMVIMGALAATLG